MIAFKKIYEAYCVANEALAEKESSARSAVQRARWSRKMILNDQAYFVMLFAQLEDRITGKCRALIKRKSATGKWGSRRSWQILDAHDVERMPFTRRVALLLEKGTADYTEVCGFYRDRCAIAHGQLGKVSPINLPHVARKIQYLASKLQS
ncbi:hypothetical protein HS125_04955 [bacterium]|nr:hypothetical protein [bacterium]